jgi:uncharacterized protein YigE (DUF2233 family)
MRVSGRLISSRSAWLILGVVLVAGAAAWQHFRAASPGRSWQGPWQRPRDWLSLASGLEWSALTRRAADGSVTVTAVRADTRRWAIHVVDARGANPAGLTADQALTGPGAAINAGFFAMADHSPIGWAVADGHTISPPYRKSSRYGDWGLLVVRHGAPSILPLASSPPDGVEQAIQSAPVLLHAGAIPPLNAVPPAPRAAIGLDGEGRLLFAVADGGLTLQEWAACLRDQLGVRDALNLDGGPSAQLAFRGTATRGTLGSTPVPLLLRLEPR